MKEVTTIGLDLAKNVFQVHGVDGLGEVVIRRQLRRRQVIPFFEKLPRCLIGVEACPTSHHWARELQALGHEVRIMPAAYVKPYVKRNKNDAADAAAICEAVTRPTMRFVAVKSREQQSLLMVHRSRSLLIRQRTMLVNAIRAHLAELGIVAPMGLRRLKALLVVISDTEDERLPSLARNSLKSLTAALMTVEQEIASAERQILAWHRSNEASRRLESIPGIGPIIATALIASAALHVATLAALAALPAVITLGPIYWVGVFVIGAVLAYEHWIVRPDDLSRIDKAFFDLNGYISLAFFAFVALA